MTAQALTLTDFLLARIAEDEAVAERLRRASVGDPWGWQPNPHPLVTCGHGQSAVHVNPARVLAECEAKRRIVEMEPDCAFDRFQRVVWDDCHETALLALALPYADHPDYDPDWRP